MRRFVVLASSMLALIGAAVAYAVSPAEAHQASATRIVIVRPVNASGHAEPGFAITTAPHTLRYPIDCRFRNPSPAAVSPNIEFCFPTVSYAVACWKAAAAHKALCLQDPRKPKLTRFERRGAFAPTAVAPPNRRGPLGIRLGDGDYCAIRAGGAWSPPPGHPRLLGFYACEHDGEVWARSSLHQGVNESQPMWTVRTAKFTTGHLVTRRVARAYFVGTAHH